MTPDEIESLIPPLWFPWPYDQPGYRSDREVRKAGPRKSITLTPEVEAAYFAIRHRGWRVALIISWPDGVYYEKPLYVVVEAADAMEKHPFHPIKFQTWRARYPEAFTALMIAGIIRDTRK